MSAHQSLKLLLDNVDRLIALILVLGCLLLILTGVDSEVKSVLTMSAGWAFGSTYAARKAKNSKPPVP